MINRDLFISIIGQSVIFILVILRFGYSQNIFTVIDSTIFEPVKFAAIAKFSTKKVIAFTNEKGEFKIYKNDSSYGGYLIKCLGYKAKIINNLSSSVIYLLPVPTELNSVIINDVNYNTVFAECIEKLKTNQDKKLNFNSFYNLYSERNSGICEVIECFYSTSSFPHKVENLLLENGRFAFFDSLADNKFISSVNLSNLVTSFNLLNEKNSNYSTFPIIPFFDFNEPKYVERKFIQSRFDGNERVVEFLIVPKEKYKRKIFTCSVFIGQKSFNLKKIILTIANPQKNILSTTNPNSICFIDSIKINILFNDFGTLNSYAEQINFEFDYNIRNGDEIIPLNTTINLVNFEAILSTNGFIQNKQATDREQISKILYEPHYWKNSNTYIANTLVKELAIRKFNEMSLFGNPLLTKTDTANFLLNQYQFCYDDTLPQFNLKEKPKNPLNFTILKRNEKEVGEIYFDIQYLYCNYNNNFKFRAFPLFDFEKSWCNDEDVRLFITNNMLPALHELTIYYYKLLINRTLELVENKVVPEKIILEKDRIIKKYYQEQAKLIDKIWTTK